MKSINRNQNLLNSFSIEKVNDYEKSAELDTAFSCKIMKYRIELEPSVNSEHGE